MSTHTSHPEIVKRLKRAEGHLKSILTMLEDSRPCLEIAQQLRGECGQTQVDGARIGMAQNIGGSGATIFTHILKTEG